MWTWDYELRTLGSWPSERYNGHNMPVEVVTKADHDAALRRAKAEVLQEVMELCLRDPLFKQFVEKGFWGAHHVDIVWRHNGQDKQHEADWLKSLWYLLRKLDARAAQIEEGE